MNKKSLIIIGKNDKINVKNFENIDEFNDFYKLHEDEINKLSTIKLNKMYHIKDFKIIRRKIDGNEDKTLCFQQIFKSEIPSQHIDERLEEIENTIDALRSKTEQTIADLNNKIKSLELENTKIKNQVIEIINAINSN